MALNPNLNQNSFLSRRPKSGKTLTEKIRELGFTFAPKPATIWGTSQQIQIKLEENLTTSYSIVLPNLNLGQIIYYQPKISYDENNPGKNFYTIGESQNECDSRPSASQQITRICDIEVISYKPTKAMKFRKKKRQSSIITRIEEILNKHKGPLPIKDPSEESINLQREAQREKDITDLPENILQEIFLHFTMRERNGWLKDGYHYRNWYYILKDPMFWTELEFRGDNVDKDVVIGLIKRHLSLRKLRFTAVPDVPDILQELCRCNHNITHLGVRHCNLSNQDFIRMILHVISCCTNLEMLDIKGMRFQSERYSYLGRLKNFKCINLTGNKLLRTQDLITLSVNCRNLQELKILDISSDQGSPLRDEDMTFIISHLQPNLRTLKMDMQQLRNVSYQAILRCSRLTCLGLKNCLHLSSEMFREFPVLKNLKKLKITRAINIKADDFNFVFTKDSMTKIEDLDINGCWGVGEIGLRAITHKLSSLKSLSLKNCKSIKGSHLVYLAECPELLHLNIAHTEVQYNHLPTLYQHTRGLQSLVIDPKMYSKQTIRQLRIFFPSIRLIMSYSEFQKDERPFND